MRPRSCVGLAQHAESHGDASDRIESIVEINSKLIALDLKSDTVRDEVGKINDGTVKDLYVNFGADYV